ncbi:aminoacyl-tRNA deacylase [Humisphaera borealis]|uniref:YbaK/EbsC family protein n=1 Tax=Humisphaera borealis TaxID=2807512 RepID=A0A7M2WTA4_9BACT|nr:YbaK/EbsC family protein [Humisphaera borealis]QOV88494.1 YbaK/EbsC family protein [Humisphaera borealis]
MSHTRLQSFLDELDATYRVSHHDQAYTAQDLAMAEHIPGKQVIKPVLVQADGQFVLCALPACYRVDLEELKNQIPARDVKLVDEHRLPEMFPDCEVGAEPPVGRLYGMVTLMDESLTADVHVTFQAGTHHQSVTMTLAEYRRVAQPEIAHFARHV